MASVYVCVPVSTLLYVCMENKGPKKILRNAFYCFSTPSHSPNSPHHSRLQSPRKKHTPTNKQRLFLLHHKYWICGGGGGDLLSSVSMCIYISGTMYILVCFISTFSKQTAPKIDSLLLSFANVVCIHRRLGDWTRASEQASPHTHS